MKNIVNKLGASALLCAALWGCEKKNLQTEPTGNNELKATAADKSLSSPSVNHYVCANGNNANDGASPATGHPWKTIRYASEHSSPGDIVYIMDEGGPFNYTAPAGSVVLIDTSGTAAAHIRFTPYASEHPKIQGSGDIFSILSITASYIDIDGVEIIGNNAALESSYGSRSATITAGNNAEGQYRANKNISTSIFAKFNMNGLSIGSKTGFTHNVTITNCKVHDCSGCGMAVEHCDWVSIEGNQSYNNGIYSMYGVSGISTKDSYNYDSDVTSNKFLIRNNICHDNQDLCYYINKPEGQLSDGNGIIIDVNNGSINADGSINYSNPYNGKTRIENNISYNNGGGGIHMVEAHNVYVVNNTTYNNGLSNNGGATVGYAEMDSYGSYDLNYYSNIMYASSRSGSSCDGYTKPKSASGAITTTGNIVYDYNVLYNGTIPVANAHYRSTNPLFISIVSPNYNFQLQSSSSPAANFGLGSTPHYSYYDILGVARPKGGVGYPDCGAYESF